MAGIPYSLAIVAMWLASPPVSAINPFILPITVTIPGNECGVTSMAPVGTFFKSPTDEILYMAPLPAPGQTV